MIGWYILGGILLLLAVVWLLRVGVDVCFGDELCVAVKIGPAKITVLPQQEKKKKPKKKKKEKTKKTAEKPAKKKEKKKLPFTFSDIRSAVPVLFEALKKALGKIRRRMRIDPLDVCVIFAGDDPAKVAEMFGWANSAMWAMMPQLERLLQIPDPHIHLGVDYERYDLHAEGRVGVTFRVGDLIVIGLTLAVPALKWYLGWRKEVKRREEAAKKAQETQKDETKNV